MTKPGLPEHLVLALLLHEFHLLLDRREPFFFSRKNRREKRPFPVVCCNQVRRRLARLQHDQCRQRGFLPPEFPHLYAATAPSLHLPRTPSPCPHFPRRRPPKEKSAGKVFICRPEKMNKLFFSFFFPPLYTGGENVSVVKALYESKKLYLADDVSRDFL